ncbi:MAG: hypothetical protein BWY10_01607 [Chloroflexi bacterium ADurb.Bin180]|nr:MAG: hypothetical protein BWY10_01607 [Chloroflexi bacterium ADurb.Bin180]
MPTLYFGFIHNFDPTVYTADIELSGYAGSLLTGVPVAYHVREDLIVAGARCLVLFEEVVNLTHAVVLAMWNGRPADDPAFDPLTGHRHRGLLRDGPRLELPS